MSQLSKHGFSDAIAAPHDPSQSNGEETATDSRPLVSIVTPIFNGERFIKETLDSVFAQTYRDWELLLIDDASTDKSIEIARQCTAQYSDKVRYFQHEGHQNKGQCASRNLGVAHAKGEFVAFLDQDDVWLPHKLEQQVAIMIAQPQAGMIYGLTEYWHSWTGRPEDIGRDYVPEVCVEHNTLVMPPTFLTLAFPLGEGAAPCTGSLMLRREAYNRVGGFEEAFRDEYMLYEDQAFLVKVYLHEAVFVAGQCWDKYRLHSDSAMASAFNAGRYHTAQSFFLNWLEKYLLEQGVKDAEIWRALNRALWPHRHPVAHRLQERKEHSVKQIKSAVKWVARAALPKPVRRFMRTQKAQWQGKEYYPPVGSVRFGDLRRLEPISPDFGYSRGGPVDRYYIEKFLAGNANDIKERVLEVGENIYTKQFGGDRVKRSDVVHVEEGNPQATIIADITRADHIESNSFDCIICTQTLHLIYDMRAAVQTLYRILKPGGIALVTVPGISQIEGGNWRDYWCWSLTVHSTRRLFEEAFPAANVEVENYGNVLAATAFLQGIGAPELRHEELDYTDPLYQVIITVRATKPTAA